MGRKSGSFFSESKRGHAPLRRCAGGASWEWFMHPAVSVPKELSSSSRHPDSHDSSVPQDQQLLCAGSEMQQ